MDLIPNSFLYCKSICFNSCAHIRLTKSCTHTRDTKTHVVTHTVFRAEGARFARAKKRGENEDFWWARNRRDPKYTISASKYTTHTHPFPHKKRKRKNMDLDRALLHLTLSYIPFLSTMLPKLLLIGLILEEIQIPEPKPYIGARFRAKSSVFFLWMLNMKTPKYMSCNH